VPTPRTVLVVVTNHGTIDHRPRTGVWFTEFSEPYAALTAAGAAITVASPLGGPAPVDPRGYPSREDIAEARDALAVLNATLPLDAVDVGAVDGVFFPGGHGPMFDLATDLGTKRCIRAAWEAGKPVAAVCHGPAALLDVELSDGTTLLHGRRVTGFTRGEDAEDALFASMPFSLQERMSAEGATFVEEPPRTVHVETDGLLVTGQNPASAAATAEAFLAVLRRARAEV
jgi:putative intracellular protease/amidase